jgi:urease accessory protein
MFAASCPSESEAARQASAVAAVRATGGVRTSFRRAGGATRIDDLHESGGYRLALPSTFASHIEAAQINTGGGVAGGDRIATEVSVGAAADVVFSTQGPERIYRSESAPARLDVALRVEAAGRLDWLPQQTILFAGARLTRRITVDVTSTSRLLMAELLTFGRPASVETASPIAIDDQWRIRRDGRLVLAEALRLDGPIATLLDRPAIGNGARTSALVLFLAPDAPDRLDAARLAREAGPCEAHASTWNGLLAARLLGERPVDVVAAVARLARALAGRDMPRVWSI